MKCFYFVIRPQIEILGDGMLSFPSALESAYFSLSIMKVFTRCTFHIAYFKKRLHFIKEILHLELEDFKRLGCCIKLVSIVTKWFASYTLRFAANTNMLEYIFHNDYIIETLIISTLTGWFLCNYSI